jgi:hypothetical protein
MDVQLLQGRSCMISTRCLACGRAYRVQDGWLVKKRPTTHTLKLTAETLRHLTLTRQQLEAVAGGAGDTQKSTVSKGP